APTLALGGGSGRVGLSGWSWSWSWAEGEATVATVDQVVGGGSVVDEGVVVPADQRQPVEVGAAVVSGPEVEMMHLTRPRWGRTAVDAAVAVPGGHRPAIGRAGGAGAPAPIPPPPSGGRGQPHEARRTHPPPGNSPPPPRPRGHP